jgi:hypothetical protein
MTYDLSWLDRTSAWWAKADRAQHHLGSLDWMVSEFRASNPYTVVPRPTDLPGRTEYRLHVHRPIPVEVSTTIGDILHNLRSALDSLAYEIARRALDRPMTPKEERACVFPVTATPEQFNQFFDQTSRYERTRIRSALYGERARAAFRSVQPFRIREEAILLGVQVTDTYEQRYRWSELYRLTQLSNLDKHQKQLPELFLSILAFLRRAAGVPNEGRSAPSDNVRRDGHGGLSSRWAVTLSNENGPSRSRPCPHPPLVLCGRHAPTMADRRGASLWSGPCARP